MALVAAGAATFVSCSRSHGSDNTIFAGFHYRVTADSLIVTDRWIFALGESKVCHIPHGNPTFSSAVPLLDSAYARGIAISDSILADSAPPHLLDCWQLLPVLNPTRCARRLMDYVEDSVVLGKSPMTTGRGLWVMAAAETGNISGDTRWLEDVAAIGSKTLFMEWGVAYNRREELLQGNPATQLGSNTYLPRWMKDVQMFERMTLMSNVVTVGAWRALAGIVPDSAVWARRADKLAHRINIALWQPDAGWYNRFLYTGIYPIATGMTDNAAQPLAIITGVPTTEMADKILDCTPWYSLGMPLLYPSPAGSPLMTYEDALPEVQALWAIAAARQGNETLLRAALGSLLLRSFGPDADTAAPLQVAMCALRIFGGLRYTADALEFHPVVPAFLKDGFEIHGLRYRNTELNISVKGSGNRIERFAVDGKPSHRHEIDGTLNGKHSVTITMAGNRLKNEPLPHTAQIWTPPTPETDLLSPKIMIVEKSGLKNVGYTVLENGVYRSQLDSAEFHIKNPQRFAEICVIPVAKGNVRGFCSSPYFYTPGAVVKTLQAEDFAPGGTSHIRDWRPSFRYVESTYEVNSIIDFVCDMREDGAYAARVCYANGNGDIDSGDACGVRVVKVNFERAGTFVLPARGDGWWLASSFSNWIILDLRKGTNHITLEYDPALYPGKSSADVLIDYLRLTKLD